ncbi:hypothetical protein DNTS_011415 [Danionella cerebrum]|uniref:Uncharacterized protein n=1 Tax=Danionella cerebrum TaxID=2873325 RepID=A0A553PVY1_9TELE|nr:hypothetical protein DNTS_011415 [Danionella translucida]
MDHSEKACRYCGVSYLILHEFQCLQDRLQEVQRELELERGSAAREKILRNELQEAETRLAELKRAVLQHQESLDLGFSSMALNNHCSKTLDLQLCVIRREMETMRLEKKTLKNELEREQTCRLHLSSHLSHGTTGRALQMGNNTILSSLGTYLLEISSDLHPKHLKHSTCLNSPCSRHGGFAPAGSGYSDFLV